MIINSESYDSIGGHKHSLDQDTRRGSGAANGIHEVSWSRKKIPRSKSYNYRNFMKLVGLEGLEPSAKGL
jgi:hypothetical protein